MSFAEPALQSPDERLEYQEKLIMPAAPIPPRERAMLYVIARCASNHHVPSSSLDTIVRAVATAVCPPGCVVVANTDLQRLCELAADGLCTFHRPDDEAMLERLWSLAHSASD
jgi:hypothetical protein